MPRQPRLDTPGLFQHVMPALCNSEGQRSVFHRGAKKIEVSREEVEGGYKKCLQSDYFRYGFPVHPV